MVKPEQIVYQYFQRKYRYSFQILRSWSPRTYRIKIRENTYTFKIDQNVTPAKAAWDVIQLIQEKEDACYR